MNQSAAQTSNGLLAPSDAVLASFDTVLSSENAVILSEANDPSIPVIAPRTPPPGRKPAAHRGEARALPPRRGLLALLLTLLTLALPAHAHIGSKDVFEQVLAGPYKFFVTIRPPTVIPGVATVEVRVSGPAISTLSITPVPLIGEAAKHPPTPDAMHRSADDPAFFTGSLWLMGSGSWQVKLQATGDAGPAQASVPVPAMALTVMRMQRPLGLILALLGLTLVVGMAGIIYGAVREARLAPGREPTLARQYRARLAGIAALVLLLLAVWGGDKWWNIEAAAYSADIFHPLVLHPTLVGSTLDLRIDPGIPDEEGRHRLNDDLLPDHGHLMHLYAIRWPEMDAVYHLHPNPVAPGELRMSLPSMPPGTYRLFADIVHRSGFPETLTASLEVPPDASHYFLDSEDAAAYPAPLSRRRPRARLQAPGRLHHGLGPPRDPHRQHRAVFRFRLLDPHGNPATGMRPYLGMAGHAAFVKTDGTAFAHTHPDGSAAMPAMMLAHASLGDVNAKAIWDMKGPADASMGAMDANRPGSASQPLAPTVEFPYGFPSPGRYRIFIQMKHDATVETGVFDAQVEDANGCPTCRANNPSK